MINIHEQTQAAIARFSAAHPGKIPTHIRITKEICDHVAASWRASSNEMLKERLRKRGIQNLLVEMAGRVADKTNFVMRVSAWDADEVSVHIPGVSRVNFYGGPGAGKTRAAARVFSELKDANASVEQVSEFVKAWTYTGRSVKPFDQMFLMGNQMQAEYQFLAHGVQCIVTDSPVLLSPIYAAHHFPELGIHEEMFRVAKTYDAHHPALNIFLNRGDKPYDTAGRWQTKEEAIGLDHEIRGWLRDTNTNYYEVQTGDYASIMELINNHLHDRA